MPLHDFKEDPVGQIANRFSILEEQVTLLREEKRAAQNEVATATHRLAASSKEVNEAKAQSRRLQENNSQLRSIILKGSNSNTDVPDDRIRNSFVELRDLIQRIVHRHYSAQGQMRLKSQGNAHFEAQKRFRNYVKDLTAEPIQKFAIRARLFKFIDDYLLRARSFGVDRYEKDLDDFERELDRSKNGRPLRHHQAHRPLADDILYQYLTQNWLNGEVEPSNVVLGWMRKADGLQRPRM